MRLVHVSDLEDSGGAAIAATRLVEGLVRSGHEVSRIVSRCGSGDQSWSVYPITSSRRAHLFAKAGRRLAGKRFLMWRDAVSARRELRSLLCRLKPDVINLHNLHAAQWGPEILDVCREFAPVVWTLHDMWSFTGRCAYSYDCAQFVAGCTTSCPTPEEYPALRPERIPRAWQNRATILRAAADAVAVAPSRWLYNQARSGLWRHHRVECIPYGLPLGVYRPEDRAFARRALDLPTDRPIGLLVADNLEERRKGVKAFAEALDSYTGPEFTLITMGNGKVIVRSTRIRVVRLGHVKQERIRVLLYNAADALLHPAPVDNLPNVVLEALACGTPVAAMPIGGLTDMVRTGVTGWLAAHPTPESLAQAVAAAMDDICAGITQRETCRSTAEREYGLDVQASRYTRLYESI